MSGGVFICYRREESAFAARAIHDRVAQRLDRENVFLDVDNIDLGVDWYNVLTERVGACDALVAVIGRSWVSSTDKDNRRRLDDPDDFVRIEIEAALKRNVRVIPVLVDGAAMPKASELPESLKGLARRQGTEVSPARFEANVQKLTIALGSILDERRRRDAAEAKKGAEPRGRWKPGLRDSRRRWRVRIVFWDHCDRGAARAPATSRQNILADDRSGYCDGYCRGACDIGRDVRFADVEILGPCRRQGRGGYGYGRQGRSQQGSEPTRLPQTRRSRTRRRRHGGGGQGGGQQSGHGQGCRR